MVEKEVCSAAWLPGASHKKKNSSTLSDGPDNALFL